MINSRFQIEEVEGLDSNDWSEIFDSSTLNDVDERPEFMDEEISWSEEIALSLDTPRK